MAKPKVKRPSRPVKAHTNGNNGEGGERGWMSASPMAWISAGISILSLAGMIYSGVFAYASLNARVETIQTDVQRNFKEDEKRYEHIQKMVDKNHEFSVKAVERIDTTISHLSQVNTKISVLETKLESINETLKRMEKQLDRADRSGGPHKMMMVPSK